MEKRQNTRMRPTSFLQDDETSQGPMKALILAPLALLSNLALADAFDEQIASIQLLQSKPVQKELGITQAQRAAMNKYADEFNKKAEAYQADLAKKSDGGKKQVQRDIAQETKMLGELKQKVLSQLSQAQIKRLRELSLQAVGVTALGDDAVAAKVGLSTEQKNKIRKLVQAGLEGANKIMEAAHQRASKGIPTPKNQAEAEKATKTYNTRIAEEQKKIQPSLDKIRADTIKNVLAVMNPNQKAAWNALQGKIFKG